MYRYHPKTIQQLRSNFNEKKRKSLNDFNDFDDFFEWYESKEKVCYFCGIKEEESQKIVELGILKSNRFPQDGVIKQGNSRGVWLEFGRLNPERKHSRSNTILCCYFCHNDKSDVFPGESYREFFQNRVGFLRNLLSDYDSL